MQRCRELAAQVFYKATELLDDQILMTGFAAGGLSQVPESFFRTASLSAPLAQEQGIFGIKPEVRPNACPMPAASNPHCLPSADHPSACEMQGRDHQACLMPYFTRRLPDADAACI